MATSNVSASTYSINTGAMGSSWNISPSYYTTSSIYASNNAYSNDIIIRREGKEDIPVAKTLEMLMERLCVIEPAMDLIAKYPALKEAYENYKIVEAMVKYDTENNDEL